MAAGLWMFAEGQRVLGVLTVAFFGLGLLVAPIMLFKPLRAELDTEGFTVHTGVRSNRYLWHQVSDIGLWSTRGTRLVTLELHDVGGVGAQLNRAVGAGAISFPPLGRSTDEAMATAIAFWQRALDADPTRP